MSQIPSLSEIENVAVDAQRGSGEPATIIDNSKLLDILNQNAIVAANNDWNRYNRFLNDYEARVKSANDIMDKEIADSDREYLKKKTVEVLKTALDDPYKIYSPEFNNSLAQIRADATSSKMARDFAEKNLSLIATSPTLNTEENKAKVMDYLQNQTVEKGGRKPFALDLPDMFNRGEFFKTLRDDPRVKELVNANRVDEPNQRYYKRQDTKYKRDPYLQLVGLSYDANPKIQKTAKAEYDALEPSLKSQFKDAKDYWVQLGGKYFGSDKDIVEQGKEDMEELGNKYKAGQLAVEWEKLNLDKKKQEFSGKTKEEQGEFLDGYISDLIKDAKTKPETYYGYKNNKIPTYEMSLSAPTFQMFAVEKLVPKDPSKPNKDRVKTTIIPDKAFIDKDAKKVIFKRYKRDKVTGEIVKEGGNFVIDENNTREMLMPEFKARIGKELLTPKDASEELRSGGQKSMAQQWAEQNG